MSLSIFGPIYLPDRLPIYPSTDDPPIYLSPRPYLPTYRPTLPPSLSPYLPTTSVV